ncbi:hypothetical protein [Acinetobacter bohemicus]|uniref:hypothetical protein n=1 Tax=Acinetobacter bohemicus TaxID=1435036 RepID=UPI00192C44FC|nr:hypothetical protein [Acinetobacter bohemicus]CAD9196688.1 hypothetical protein QAC21B_02841 [Acinetobacter bohemicus]
MNLIEELGIETARAIVDGAPEGRDTYCLDAKDYFKQLPIMKRCSVCVDLGDLRTAIADYECDHDWEDISSMGDVERQLICTCCSMKKSEPFGLNAQQFNGSD